MINPEITLAEVKKHLAITHTVNDDYISSLIPVGIKQVRNDIDRNLGEPVCLDENGNLDEPLRQAMLLAIGTLYDFRAGQQVEQLNDNQAYERLIKNYRRMGV